MKTTQCSNLTHDTCSWITSTPLSQNVGKYLFEMFLVALMTYILALILINWLADDQKETKP